MDELKELFKKAFTIAADFYSQAGFFATSVIIIMMLMIAGLISISRHSRVVESSRKINKVYMEKLAQYILDMETSMKTEINSTFNSQSERIKIDIQKILQKTLHSSNAIGKEGRVAVPELSKHSAINVDDIVQPILQQAEEHRIHIEERVESIAALLGQTPATTAADGQSAMATLAAAKPTDANMHNMLAGFTQEFAEHRKHIAERIENIAALLAQTPAADGQSAAAAMAAAKPTDANMHNMLASFTQEFADHRKHIAERIENIAALLSQTPATDGQSAAAMAAAIPADANMHNMLTRFTQEAEEHRNRLESRVEGLSELIKNQRQTNAAEMVDKLRDSIEQQGIYLHDEFAAITDRIKQSAAGVQQPAVVQPAAGQPPASVAIADVVAPMSQNADTMLAQISNQITALQHRPAGDQTALFEMLSQSVNRLSAEVDAKLTLLDSKLEKNMETRWSNALVSLNTLRERVEELAATGEQLKTVNQNVTSLSRLMMSRTGADEQGGQMQLSDLLTQMLSSDNFVLDADLPNGHSASAMVRFPDHLVPIDAGVSLQSFVESLDDNLPPSERDIKRQAFRRELTAHINYIADNLILPPHTGETALMFVSSESAFAEIHARHRAAVKLALSRRVWLVSPTTLLAVINTANTAIRDHHAQIRLQQLQKAVAQIVEEARHFEHRLTEIGDHVNSAWRSVQRAETASDRLIGSIRGISQEHATGIESPIPPSVTDDSA